MIVTLLTSRIHDQSKVILPLLYTCSTSTYNVEVNRLNFTDVRKTTHFVKLSTCRVNNLFNFNFLYIYIYIITHTVVLQTERLIFLLTTDDIMLTGMRFFSITRNFMLAVRTNHNAQWRIFQCFICNSFFDTSITFLNKK